MSELTRRLVRDAPADPIMQEQWVQEAIPWCTFHDSPEKGGGFCWHNHDVLLNPKVPLVRLDDCVVSTGGPDHKWWVDV